MNIRLKINKKNLTSNIPVLILLLIIIFSLVLIFLNNKNQTKKITEVWQLNKNLQAEIDLIKLKSVEDSKILMNQVLGAVNTPIPTLEPIPTIDTSGTGFIEISNEAGTINIYEDPSLDSGIVGLATTGKMFLYLKKEGAWYQVGFNQNQNGWIQETSVKEISK